MGLPVSLKRCPYRAKWESLTVSGVRVVAADGVFSSLLFHLQQKARRNIIFPDIRGKPSTHTERKDKGPLPASSSLSTHPQSQRLRKEAPRRNADKQKSANGCQRTSGRPADADGMVIMTAQVQFPFNEMSRSENMTITDTSQSSVPYREEGEIKMCLGPRCPSK